jgi:four helix bundle protein
MASNSFRDLTVYKKSFALAMQIFELTKKFPVDEKYSLTSQIRRSSRSVSSNIGEGYRKRVYRPLFISKSTDSDMENTETQVWLDFSLACGYINDTTYNELLDKSEEVGKLLNHMLEYPEKYLRANEKFKSND